MTLLSFYIALTFPINNGNFTGDFWLDINPVVGIHMPTWEYNTAITFPGVIFYGTQLEFRKSGDIYYYKHHTQLSENTLRHELAHSRQQAALGSAFWLAYAATIGRPFEPYDSFLHIGLASHPFGVQVFTEDSVWMPESEMEQTYPLFRLTYEKEFATIEMFPGYPRLFAP